MPAVREVTQLLYGSENIVCADAGYTGVDKRPEHEVRQVISQIAAHHSTHKHLSNHSVLYKAQRRPLSVAGRLVRSFFSVKNGPSEPHE